MTHQEQRICAVADESLATLLRAIPAGVSGDRLRVHLLNVLLDQFVSSPPTPNEMSLVCITLAALVRLKELEAL